MQTLLDEHKRLEFTFGDTQEVLRYDSSRFYRDKIERHVSGISAVDFLCIDPDEKKSFMIEAKDFRSLEGTDAQVHRRRETAEELALKVSQKVFDTIAVLFVATFSLQCDDEEKSYAKRFLKRPIHVVFHYELPQKWKEADRKQRMADMRQKLKNKLQTIDPSLRVEDSTTARYWTVTRRSAS